MKTVRLLTMCCGAFLALGLPSRADYGSGAASSNSSSTDDTANPGDPQQMDSDVPEAFLAKQEKPSAAQIEEAKAQQEKAKANQDWLLKGYEQQVQEREQAKGKSTDDDSDFYAQLSQDKDLAKAAGLTDPSLTSTDTQNPPTPAPAATESAPPPSSTTEAPAAGVKSDLFTPLITPLSSTSSLGLQHYDLGPAPTSSVFSESTPSTPAPAVDTEDMDVPGMTAVDRNPEAKQERDLSLDLLPGEDPADTTEHPHTLDLQLPDANASDHIQQQQNSAIIAPGEKKPAPIVRPVVPAPSDTSEMVPDPTPIRIHIADPYDILQ
jgi:hypothetical protein